MICLTCLTLLMMCDNHESALVYNGNKRFHEPTKNKEILPPGWGIGAKIRPINMELVGNHEQSNISALEVSSWPLHHEHIPLASVSLQNERQKMNKITI
jgi:hypothetical protein